MENNNGKFLNNLAKYLPWIFALLAVGWSASNILGSKVDASDIKVMQAQINEAINANGKQDTEIKIIYDSLTRIEKKIDQISGYKK